MKSLLFIFILISHLIFAEILGGLCPDFFSLQAAFQASAETKYTNGILVRTKQGKKFFAQGSLLMRHSKLKDLISIEKLSNSGDEIESILWAGEIEISNGKITKMNRMAGIHIEEPDLTRDSSIKNLREAVQNAPLFKNFLSEKIEYIEWTEGSKNLHEDLNSLANFRHNFGNLMQKLTWYDLFFRGTITEEQFLLKKGIIDRAIKELDNGILLLNKQKEALPLAANKQERLKYFIDKIHASPIISKGEYDEFYGILNDLFNNLGTSIGQYTITAI